MASNLLDGRRALVIGGAAGIGQATARLFSSEGAQVVVGDIDDEAGSLVATELQEAGSQAAFVHVDVTQKPVVEAALGEATAFLGGLDILVVTPFVTTVWDLMSLTPEDWQREIDVLATGTLFAFQAAIPIMKASGGGVLLATSSSHFSDYGAMNHAGILPAYAAGKAAVELLVRIAARLHAADGIRAAAVQPGLTETRGLVRDMLPSAGVDLPAMEAALGPSMPMGVLQPEAVAAGFLFLASDYASYITGYSLPVEGGVLTHANGKLLMA